MLLSLYVSTFAIRASFAIMLIVFPLYILSLKSYFLFGIVLSSSPAFELITVLGLGAYIDRHGRKHVLLLGLLTGSIALFALLVSTDPVYLFAVNAVHGMSAAAILVSSLALLADYAPPERRGRAMGAFDFVNIFGWISGFGIGGLLIDLYHDNIGMAFVFAGGIALFAFALAFLNVHEPHKEAHLGSEISFRVIASVLKQRSVILLVAPWFIIYLLISTMLTFTSKAGTQELGLTGTQLGLILGGGGAIFLVTQVVYGQLSDKYGRTRIMIVGTAGIVGIMLTVGGVFLTAPAVIAPASGRLLYVGSGADTSAVLQSDLGVYLLNTSDGTVASEVAPPEGGFGRLFLPQGGNGSVFISVTEFSVGVIRAADAHFLWSGPSNDPGVVAAADIDRDGLPEIFVSDRHGLNFTGPDMPSPVPVLPTLFDGEVAADAVWMPNGALALLVVAENGSRLIVASATGDVSVPLEPGTKLLAHGPAAGVGPLVAAYGAGGAQIINTSTPTIADIVSFPSGWAASWVCGPSGAETLVAYPPSGRIAVFFVEGGSGLRARAADLPGDFRSVAWSCAGVPGPGADSSIVVFAGYYANGTLVRVQMAVSHNRVDTDQGGGVMSVMVKRETAQATFSHLTSPAIAIALGIFALMAGAFGPAALAGLTDVSQADKRGTTMGLYSVVISSSMIVGPVTTGYLVDNYGGFGVMVFLVASASAMGLLMALRAWDVRRAGGEHKLHPVPREQLAEPPSPGEIASPPAADSDLAALALPPQAVDPPPEK